MSYMEPFYVSLSTSVVEGKTSPNFPSAWVMSRQWLKVHFWVNFFFRDLILNCKCPHLDTTSRYNGKKTLWYSKNSIKKRWTVFFLCMKSNNISFRNSKPSKFDGMAGLGTISTSKPQWGSSAAAAPFMLSCECGWEVVVVQSVPGEGDG